jgi:hypothetical protein
MKINKSVPFCPDLYEGHENIPGLIDSPDNHIDLWEKKSSFVIPFTELTGSEYQEIPRGRVMYSSKDDISLVYMDKTLHLDGTKELISTFFQLNNIDVKWLRDEHYTTDLQIIDDYFDDHEH